MDHEPKENVEFSEQQTARLDEVAKSTVTYLISLLDQPLSVEEMNALWDANIWCEIADFASEILLKHGMHAHFPTRIWDDDGDDVVVIENYYGKGE